MEIFIFKKNNILFVAKETFSFVENLEFIQIKKR